jgi:hypothetical protein
MPQGPSWSAVIVYRADGVVAIAVRGEPDPRAVSQVRELIVSGPESGMQRLVLNLMHASDRSGAACLALIAVTRDLLPPGRVVDVCTSNPAVQDILALAGWNGPDPAARPCRSLSPGSRECPILGMARDAVLCAGPVHPSGAR